MNLLLLCLLVLCSIGIAVQDFKTRLISVWLIVIFTISNIALYLLLNSIYKFIENIIFCICYFLFSFLIISLFYYVKTKKIEPVINRKIGLGDIIIFFSVGICIEPIHLVYYFTLNFIIAIIVHLISGDQKTIPLAGITVITFSGFLAWRLYC